MMRKSIFNRMISLLLALVFAAVYIPVDLKSIAAENNKIIKAIYLQKGLNEIAEFFNQNSEEYFGKKIESFFNEQNLSLVKTKIEEYAASKGKSTKEVMNEIMANEFEKHVFGILDLKLKKIANNYKSNIEKIENKMIAEVSKIDIALSAANGLLCTLGVSAAILAAYGALTAQVTSLWMALVVWWTGAYVGWGGAMAAVVSGPWGWLILAGIVAGAYWSNNYCKKEAERQINMIKENLMVKVGAMKPIIEENWRRIF